MAVLFGGHRCTSPAQTGGIGNRCSNTYLLLNRCLAAGVVLTIILAGHHHHSDDGDGPSKTDEVCGGFNLGMSPDQIRQGLQRNDGRENPWAAQRDSAWPIITGRCG